MLPSVSTRVGLREMTASTLIAWPLPVMTGRSSVPGNVVVMSRRGPNAKWETLPPVKRECRYYRLTPLGRKQLAREESKWNRLAKAIASVLSSEKPA